MFIGRGLGYPIAMEGALKLKELSYVHAEGYAAGELKHGPIALLDADTPLVAIATQGATVGRGHDLPGAHGIDRLAAPVLTALAREEQRLVIRQGVRARPAS